MIKCNINRGERIYHLPFDQQYHRTEIKNTGEFYAMTVKEATQEGFLGEQLGIYPSIYLQHNIIVNI